MFLLNFFNKCKIYLIFSGFFILLTGCGAAKISEDAPIQINYLDEYIIPKDFKVEGTQVGGLSDLDFDGNSFYTVVDLPSSPRIYRFSLKLRHQKIDTLVFEELIEINHTDAGADSLFWDTEGLVYNSSKNNFIVSSEGSIKSNKNPFIAELDKNGKLLETFELPDYFRASAPKGLRNNSVFEGLTLAANQRGVWAATELPLKRDGPRPKLYRTQSPVRFTHFDLDHKSATHQFAYPLDRIRKIPILPFAMNGVTAIWEYEPGLFIVLERSFSAGHSAKGFAAQLYWVDARNATNTLEEVSLKKRLGKDIIPAKKELIFDFRSIRSQLSRKTIDNLEGITPGPILSNGNQSLLLISDNNFSSWTPQLNRVLLMEIINP